MDGSDGSESASILHVDMDAFFASVELRERPELKGKPVIIGGLGPRSVVVSATYEARALGVHAAMPMQRAMRLAPRAEVIPPTQGAYSKVSDAVMAIFGSITPDVEQISVDEAFLDVRGSMRRLGSPRRIAEQIRAAVVTEQGITCSVGAAAVKFVAKIASDACKPDGLLVVPAEETVAFLRPLPVRRLWGVGAKTAGALERLGLRTVADVAATSEPLLMRALGQAAGRHVWNLAHGRDPRPVAAGESERSIGAEETFAEDVADDEVIRRELLRLSERVARRVRASGSVTRTVVLKVRFADFTTITRSKSLTRPVDTAQDVFGCVSALWSALDRRSGWIRLVGVRCEKLAPADSFHYQPTLGEPRHGRRDVEFAQDDIAAKFGASAVLPGSLLRSQALDSSDKNQPISLPDDA